MNIRRFDKKDAEILAKLDIECHKEGISPFMSVYTKSDFLKFNRKGSYVFVAENNKNVVGYVLAHRKRAKRAMPEHNLKALEKYIEIDSLFIIKKFRRRKTGSKLLKALLDAAKKDNHYHVFLSADSGELNNLIKFYESHGFKRVFLRMYGNV